MAKKTEQQSFDKALQELEVIVKRLEEGELTLEETIDLYQQGMQLSKQCHDKLELAEKKVQQIVEQQGALKLEPFHNKDGE